MKIYTTHHHPRRHRLHQCEEEHTHGSYTFLRKKYIKTLLLIYFYCVDSEFY